MNAMNPRGMSLVEVMIVTGIVGFLALVLANAGQMMARTHLRQQAEVELHQNAKSLLVHFKNAMEKAGDGLPNSFAEGAHIMADMAAAPSPSILFLWRDAAPVAGGPATVPGRLDGEDTWMRFRLDNGRVVEERFRSADSRTIVNGLVPVVPGSQRMVPLTSPAVRVSRLEFSYYDAANNQIQGGFAASRVRVYMELTKAGGTSPSAFVLKKEGWVLLKNVINARVS